MAVRMVSSTVTGTIVRAVDLAVSKNSSLDCGTSVGRSSASSVDTCQTQRVSVSGAYVIYLQHARTWRIALRILAAILSDQHTCRCKV